MIIVSALLNANHMSAECARAAQSLGAEFVPLDPPSPSSPTGMNRLIVCATALSWLPVKRVRRAQHVFVDYDLQINIFGF